MHACGAQKLPADAQRRGGSELLGQYDGLYGIDRLRGSIRSIVHIIKIRPESAGRICVSKKVKVLQEAASQRPLLGFSGAAAPGKKLPEGGMHGRRLLPVWMQDWP